MRLVSPASSLSDFPLRSKSGMLLDNPDFIGIEGIMNCWIEGIKI